MKTWFENRRTNDKSLKERLKSRRKRLEAAYDHDQYPTETCCEEIAKEYGMTAKQVETWFINRRTNDKSLKEKLKTRRKRLETAYDHERYPTATEHEKIAKECGMTANQVRKWFNRRRRSDKKKQLKLNLEHEDVADDPHPEVTDVDG